MSNKHLYMVMVYRPWPVDLVTGDIAAITPGSIGYLAVFDSLEKLKAEFGNNTSYRVIKEGVNNKEGQKQ